MKGNYNVFANILSVFIAFPFTKILKKRIDFLQMIAISKAEKEAISALFPNAHIVRTMKKKSKRHHYYCEESRSVMRYLNKTRGNDVDADKTREGARYTNRKKRK